MDMGKVETVKRKLWQNGYSVKDVSGMPGVGYDLLVDGKYQVRVVEQGEEYKVATKVIVATCYPDRIEYYVCRGGKCMEETSITKAFPKVDTKD